MKEDIYLSVIIPVRDSRTTLGICIESILSQTGDETEIIVVDDASSDASAEMARGLGCRTVIMEYPSGPARARNAGADLARGRVLLFADADVLFRQGSVKKLLSALEKGWDACIGIYTPAPLAGGFFSFYKNVFIRHHHLLAKEKIDWFWSACGAVKKDMFKRVGGYDERFGQKSVEDIELGYRLTGAGAKILNEKSAQVEHMRGFTFKTALHNDLLKSRDWIKLNLGSGAACGKHPSSTLRGHGLSVLAGGLFFVLIPVSIFAPIPYWTPAAALFLSWFFGSALLMAVYRNGGAWTFIRALLFLPLDGLVICLGAAVGAAEQLTRKKGHGQK